MSYIVFKLPNRRSRLAKSKPRMRRSGNWVLGAVGPNDVPHDTKSLRASRKVTIASYYSGG